MPYLSMSHFYRLSSNRAHAMFDLPPVDFPPDPEGPDDTVEKILSFGQILAGSAILQPLYQVLRLTLLNRRSIMASLKSLPTWFWDGVIYFFTGDLNPWEEIRRRKEQMDIIIEMDDITDVSLSQGEQNSLLREGEERSGVGDVVSNYRR